MHQILGLVLGLMLRMREMHALLSLETAPAQRSRCEFCWCINIFSIFDKNK
jgi:hypothetical protein